MKTYIKTEWPNYASSKLPRIINLAILKTYQNKYYLYSNAVVLSSTYNFKRFIRFICSLQCIKYMLKNTFCSGFNRYLQPWYLKKPASVTLITSAGKSKKDKRKEEEFSGKCRWQSAGSTRKFSIFFFAWQQISSRYEFGSDLQQCACAGMYDDAHFGGNTRWRLSLYRL